MRAGARIKLVAPHLRPTVHREMFRRRYRFQILRVISLETGHEGNGHPTCQKRILTIGFLAAAPARISEDVDVRRPEIQAIMLAISIVLGARLGRNNISNAM